MNTSYKCNCCCKEDVCQFKKEYMEDCAAVKAAIHNSRVTEVSIKCSRFLANKVTTRGGLSWINHANGVLMNSA